MLYIHHHLGLGDHICLNGLVRQYAKKNNVILFCKQHNLDCLTFMYRDIDIELLVVPEWSNKDEITIVNRLAGDNLLRIGFDNISEIKKANPLKGCDEWFYMQCGVDYSVRFDGFYIERDYSEEERVYKKLNPTNGDYVFVHDDKFRGYQIHVDGNVIGNDPSENLFYMGLTIERATEVHLMESSLRCYAEHLSPAGTLFYHDIRESSMCKNSTRKKWYICKDY